MTTSLLLDAAGRRRSPATMPGHRCGRPSRNKGRRYPADPPTVEEFVAVMRTAGQSPQGLRVRALIIVLWRAELRISEALALAESDLDRVTGAVLVRRGKGGKRREVGTDRWGWQQIQPWLDFRPALPVGALLCVMHGPTAGRPWSPSAARSTLPSPSRPASGDASRHTSSATRTRSRWPARASRSRSSSASSATRTSASRLSTCKHRQQRDHQQRLRTPRSDAARKRRTPLTAPELTRWPPHARSLPVVPQSGLLTRSHGRATPKADRIARVAGERLSVMKWIPGAPRSSNSTHCKVA